MAYDLLHLPLEVLHSILVNTKPDDLGRLCCCRTLNDYIKNNKLLHKEVYLKHFDGLPQVARNAEMPWAIGLKKIIRVQKILESKNAIIKASASILVDFIVLISCWSDNIDAVYQVVQDLLTTAAVGSEPGLNVPFLTALFETEQNKDIFLCRSFLFSWAKEETWGHSATYELRKDIAAMLTGFESDCSSVGQADLEAAGSAIVISDNVEATALAHVNLVRSRVPTLSCSSNYRRTEEPIEDDSRHRTASYTSSVAQLSAKLHCLYGVPIDTVRKGSGNSPRYSLRSDTSPLHPYARSRVYDLRQHTDNSFWGPYLDDGSYDVDWQKMEAIMIILDHNMKLPRRDEHEFQGIIGVQEKPFVGAIPNSFISPMDSILMEPTLSVCTRCSRLLV